MRWEVYATFMFGMAVILYLMGFSPIGAQFLSHGSAPVDIGNSASPSSQNAGLLSGAMLIAIGTGVFLITLLLGYSAIYIIPLIILVSLLDFFILPMNFLFGLPGEWQLITVAFFNLMRVLAVMNFVRGSV